MKVWDFPRNAIVVECCPASGRSFTYFTIRHLFSICCSCSVPNKHVLPGSKLDKGVNGPYLIQTSEPPGLKRCGLCLGAVHHRELQIYTPGRISKKSTSLLASWNDLISTRPLTLWSRANNLLKALSTILPLPSTLHLCSLSWLIEQVGCGLQSMHTCFQQHLLLPAKDPPHQMPTPEIHFDPQLFQENVLTLPVALFSRQLSHVLLQSWFSKPLQSPAFTEFTPDAFTTKLMFRTSTPSKKTGAMIVKSPPT